MGWLRTIITALCLLILPGAGWGADLRLGLAGAVEYDDNVTRTQFGSKEDDFIFRVTPNVTLIEDRGKLHWNLVYLASWEKAAKTERVDGFRHFVNTGARYQLSGRTQVFFSERFSYSEAIDSTSAIDDPGSTPTVGSFREEVLRNSATLGAQHNFSPRLAGNFAFTQRLFQTGLGDRADNRAFVGNTNLVYTLSERHRLGGGLAATFHDFDELDNRRRPSSQTLFFNLYGTWTWLLDETTTFQLTAGPTLIDTDQEIPPPSRQDRRVPFVDRGLDGVTVADFTTCGTVTTAVDTYTVLERCSGRLNFPDGDPVADDIRNVGVNPNPLQTLNFVGGEEPAGGSRSEWTFFGEASLTRRWTPNVVSSVSYRRAESTASGLSTSTVLDIASLLTTWRISELWNAAVRADFTRRTSTTSIEQTFTVVDDTFPSCNECAAIINTGDPSEALVSAVVDESIDTDRWGVALRIARRINQNLTVSGRYTYNRQQSRSRTAGRSSDFQNHLITLGVQYQFDRWRLW